MKHILVICLFLTIILINCQNTCAQSVMLMQASITFHTDGKEPSSSIPYVTDQITINLMEPSGQTRSLPPTTIYKSISVADLKIQGDSLIIYPGTTMTIMPLSIPAGIPYISGTSIVFNEARLYKAYMHDSTQLSFLGNFRILPKISTAPFQPAANKPVILNLVAGQTHSACPPALSDKM
ncbi:MAG: hypothetical protein ABIA63_06560, partial [bacterium]